MVDRAIRHRMNARYGPTPVAGLDECDAAPAASGQGRPDRPQRSAVTKSISSSTRRSTVGRPSNTSTVDAARVTQEELPDEASA